MFEGLATITEHLQNFGGPWGFCGGWGIDLFLGRITRPHKDIDLALLRRDQLACRTCLSALNWSFDVAHDGELAPWFEGQFLDLPRHTIFCRPKIPSSTTLELLLNESEEQSFLFRRDPSIRLPLSHAFQFSVSGLPFLAPEIILLYKAPLSSPENDADFGNAWRHLNPDCRNWFRQALRTIAPEHRWLKVD